MSRYNLRDGQKHKIFKGTYNELEDVLRQARSSVDVDEGDSSSSHDDADSVEEDGSFGTESDDTETFDEDLSDEGTHSDEGTPSDESLSNEHFDLKVCSDDELLKKYEYLKGKLVVIQEHLNKIDKELKERRS